MWSFDVLSLDILPRSQWHTGNLFKGHHFTTTGDRPLLQHPRGCTVITPLALIINPTGHVFLTAVPLIPWVLLGNTDQEAGLLSLQLSAAMQRPFLLWDVPQTGSLLCQQMGDQRSIFKYGKCYLQNLDDQAFVLPPY